MYCCCDQKGTNANKSLKLCKCSHFLIELFKPLHFRVLQSKNLYVYSLINFLTMVFIIIIVEEDIIEIYSSSSKKNYGNLDRWL